MCGPAASPVGRRVEQGVVPGVYVHSGVAHAASGGAPEGRNRTHASSNCWGEGRVACVGSVLTTTLCESRKQIGVANMLNNDTNSYASKKPFAYATIRWPLHQEVWPSSNINSTSQNAHAKSIKKSHVKLIDWKKMIMKWLFRQVPLVKICHVMSQIC